MSERDFAFLCIWILELLTVTKPVKIVLESSDGDSAEGVDELLQTGMEGIAHVGVPGTPVLRIDCHMS